MTDSQNCPPGFAQIAVLAQLGRAGGLFTYGVPEALWGKVRPGVLVQVPFARRQLQGVVYSLEDECDLPSVRDIREVADPEPVMTEHQLRLARWIADYYAAPVSDVFAAMVPSGLGRKTVYLLQVGDASEGARLTPEQRQVLDVVEAAGSSTVDALAARLPELEIVRAVDSLVRRRYLLRTSELAPPRATTRRVRVLSATEAGRIALQSGEGLLQRARRQRDVLKLIVAGGVVPLSEVSAQIQGARAAVTALVGRGFVTLQEQESSRSPVADGRWPSTQPMHLSEAQAAAFRPIAGSVKDRRSDIYLLHGVTGSGKTEVYLRAIAETIRSGRQAIMMVPEISLTPQAVERVAGRFPGRVAVLHSKLTPTEQMGEWQRIRHGHVDVVVGPRSAGFAPLPNPGLIIVDEEHDPSYKQDATPRYHARDAAAVLGRLTGATVVFGSATPDVGTYYAARQGRIRLIELPDRPVWKTATDACAASVPSRPMPSVQVVDMRQELKLGNRGMFSEPLMQALTTTLEQHHQALLFLNRRGSATVVLCRDCGFVMRCPHCDIPFTYHAAATRLICHRCDKRIPNPSVCPGCHGPRIRYLGVGTQRVEEEVRRVFPHARTLRWDRDVTGGAEAHEQILRAFANHEADILVGTQMIAKGLDFPLVTLVGVISADTGLHMPDFRAPERSFQLLTQVAGRAGRAQLPSQVVVQTYTPDHYAILAARDHDYARYYREEMTFRLAACYPPFARMVRFVYSGEQPDLVQQSAHNLRSILEKGMAEASVTDVEIIGPAPCFVARARERYYWQIIARGRGSANTSLQKLLEYIPAGWTIDVDPVDLL